MMRAAAVALTLIVVGATVPGGTNDYPTDYFRSPIGIPILLSGTFAELRSNHFHSGLDIKTNGKAGYRVYAAADGHVVRIKVSPTGFGNALYVRHPNGYTTVYAHLRNFKDEIQDWVKRQQYRTERFAVDLFPDPSLFRVSKGEVIAISGNSGSSGGPHLHFEIRDSATEWPLNPLLFGLKVTDNRPPQIRKIKIYAMDEASMAAVRFSNGTSQTVTIDQPVLLRAVGNGRSFELEGVRAISAIGRLGFGIETRDYHNGSRSRLGPYLITLFVDDKTIFRYVAEKFSFANTRFLNAHVDYAERHQNKRWVQRSYLLPGNKLPAYESVVDDGVVTIGPGSVHTIRYEVVDTPGNSTSLTFSVRGDDKLVPPAQGAKEGELIRFGEGATFRRDGFRAAIPEDAFYQDTWLRYNVREGDDETYSPRYVFHDPATPVHKHIELALWADALPPRLQTKAALAYVDDEGKVSLQPAPYRDGWVKSNVRTLGEYFVSVDTVAPRIRSIEISSGRRLRFRISDDETGIASYRGTVDGQWVLFEYDAKSRILEHRFDGRVGRGSHTLRLEVTDNVGNSSVYESRFTR